jgi:hypothetical protein
MTPDITRIVLADLPIDLVTHSQRIASAWRTLFAPCVQAERRQPPRLCLTLDLTDSVPPAPADSPYFVDKHFQFADNVGALSTYRLADGHVLLHFADGAQVTVSLAPARAGETLRAHGMMGRAVFNYQRFEDIVFVSLAPLLRRVGAYIVHASAVALAGRALILVGRSGSGKTTTSLQLMLQGWGYLANDALLMRRETSGLMALPTANEIGIRPKTIDLFPTLATAITTVNGDAIIPSPASVGGEWAAPAHAAVICFPTIAPNQPETRVEAIPRAVALARLMEQSVDVWDEPMLAAHTRFLTQLSHQCACYDVHLGHDTSALPTQLADLVEG